MNKVIGILLIGLLGFSGCSSSDAESSPAYNVQAIGMINGSELSVSAYVMDQEEKPSSDVMITINGEPMNIGFFSAEDLNIDGEDSLTDNNSNVQGVASWDFQPFYFLDSFDLNEVDTMNFVARGRNGSTLLTSSNVVPEEKLTLIEPSSDATFYKGQEVHMKWEGGDPYTCFEVSYVGGSEDVTYSTGWIEDMTEYSIPVGIIDGGLLFASVSARRCSDIHEDAAEPIETGRTVLELHEGGVWTITSTTEESTRRNFIISEFGRCIRKAYKAETQCSSQCQSYDITTQKGRDQVARCTVRKCRPKLIMRKKACAAKYCSQALR